MEIFSTSSITRLSYKEWRYFGIAAVLFIAQFFLQLHYLEHLEETDHEEHSGEICVVCILSSSLENGYFQSQNTVNLQSYKSQKPEYSYSYIASDYITPYLVRGPPTILHF